MKKNKQATMDKRFLDPDSYVTPDGREILKGKDWKARVEDLRLRSGGRCERAKRLGKPHVFLCSGKAEEPHHIIPRSQGRDDRVANLAGLSHACHSAEDPRKVRSDRKEFRTGLTLASTTSREVSPAKEQ